MLIFGIIILATIILATVIGKYLQKKFERKANDQSVYITKFSFIRHILTATIYLFGFGWALLSLPISATFTHSLFAGAGVFTLILVFASKQVLSFVISGIFLISKRPFKINDTEEMQGHKGKVKELNLHDTIIEDEDNNKIIIPNSLILNGVIKNIKK